ncbi:hypothetical protein EDC04DRAFT_2613080 [Pisolithus marmoratus]|nr:hypothetical protein EDC04DRAFT_2613080 [Pisolithus marmoratus]
MYHFQTGITASFPLSSPFLTIGGYSWLNDSLMVQQEMSMSKPVLVARMATMPENIIEPTSNVETSNAMLVGKVNMTEVPIMGNVTGYEGCGRSWKSSYSQPPSKTPSYPNMAQPFLKKTCISQGGQASQNGAATSSLSAPLPQVNLIIHLPVQDCMQVLEQELADCHWNVTTLTHEMEALRTTALASANEDLLNLFRLSNNSNPVDEAKESIAAELHRLVLMAMLSTHNIRMNQPIEEGSRMGAPAEVESGLVVVGNQSGVMSTQNDEEDHWIIGCIVQPHD